MCSRENSLEELPSLVVLLKAGQREAQTSEGTVFHLIKSPAYVLPKPTFFLFFLNPLSKECATKSWGAKLSESQSPHIHSPQSPRSSRGPLRTQL